MIQVICACLLWVLRKWFSWRLSWKISFLGQAGNSVVLGCVSEEKPCCMWRSGLNGLFHKSETWAAQTAKRRKIITFLLQGDVCLTIISPFVTVFYCFLLDELSWVSFAYEDFQQPQLGFNVLVFIVLHRQRRAVLLLHISVGASLRWKSTNISQPSVTYLFCKFLFPLPSILPKELVLELF